ncbi:helix-turn-helix domain-containing protein [Caulobacter segnis]
MSQIAEILGYSELSAFDRAFRRWYDRPPSAIRRQAAAAAAA